MAKKKKKCNNYGCNNITTGRLCMDCKRLLPKRHASRQDCARDSVLKIKYGIDNMGFDVLWQAFRGRCAICDNELRMPLPQRGQPLDVVAIDHDHITGNIRGLLCNACNKGLGLFRENEDYLLSAVKYLKTCRGGN